MKEKKEVSLTFEDDGIVVIVVWYTPEVSKSPRVLRNFEKYPARLIGDNPDLRVLLKILDRVELAFTIVIWRIREFVEMGVLFESETPFILEAGEIPKNFC
jgi:hypothetical protein